MRPLGGDWDEGRALMSRNHSLVQEAPERTLIPVRIHHVSTGREVGGLQSEGGLSPEPAHAGPMMQDFPASRLGEMHSCCLGTA